MVHDLFLITWHVLTRNLHIYIIRCVVDYTCNVTDYMHHVNDYVHKVTDQTQNEKWVFAFLEATPMPADCGKIWQDFTLNFPPKSFTLGSESLDNNNIFIFHMLMESSNSMEDYLDWFSSFFSLLATVHFKRSFIFVPSHVVSEHTEGTVCVSSICRMIITLFVSGTVVVLIKRSVNVQTSIKFTNTCPPCVCHGALDKMTKNWIIFHTSDQMQWRSFHNTINHCKKQPKYLNECL